MHAFGLQFAGLPAAMLTRLARTGYVMEARKPKQGPS